MTSFLFRKDKHPFFEVSSQPTLYFFALFMWYFNTWWHFFVIKFQARVNVPCVSTQTQNKNLQKSPFSSKPEIQVGRKQQVMENFFLDLVYLSPFWWQKMLWNKAKSNTIKTCRFWQRLVTNQLFSSIYTLHSNSLPTSIPENGLPWLFA